MDRAIRCRSSRKDEIWLEVTAVAKIFTAHTVLTNPGSVSHSWSKGGSHASGLFE